MNKTAIKNYAVWARVQLIEAVKQRAFEYEITEGENDANLEAIGGRLLSKTERAQRAQLIELIKQKGFDEVMEEAAYTWFNRFIALRFMEVNGFLPARVRVFTDETGAFKPELLKEALNLDIEGVDKAFALELIEKQDNETLYKYLLIALCNSLNAGLPFMFEKIANPTELLFPRNLLRPDSVIGRMVTDIPEEDWHDAVQIIGWLYQYYNTELKDDTFAKLKNNIKITKERLPAATQLFTPDWIVRYMVENSLGRLWLEGHPDDGLKANWKYYLDEAEQDPAVQAQLAEIRKTYAALKPEDIKIIDPCMGSGHILVYAFDVLMQIYVSAGWSERDAAKSIIENNLYGLDIDNRAGQLACFAVMMKARQYSRRILSLGVKPNVLPISDSAFMTEEFIAYTANGSAALKADLEYIKEVFRDAKEYGSIIDVKPVDFAALYERIDIIARSFAEDFYQAEYIELAKERLAPLVQQAQIMSQKYDVVVTNPPYMGSSNMSAKLGEFVKKYYPDSKSDLFAVFIEKCGGMIKKNGYQAMITQHAWMFLSSFENLRTKLLNKTTVNMAHLGARAFEEIGGEVVQTTSFVLQQAETPNYTGTYCRLIEPTTQQGKEDMFLAGENRYYAKQNNFSKIPSSPVAYWVSEKFVHIFNYKTAIYYSYYVSKGIITTDNNKYLRLWYEVSQNSITNDIWHKYSKGGQYRKWYGNCEYVVFWKNDGESLKQDKKALITPAQYYNYPHFVWSGITMYKPSFRLDDKSVYFDDVAPAVLFQDTQNMLYLLACCNTKVVEEILKILNPTIHFLAKDIKALPVIIDNFWKETIDCITQKTVDISKSDWDSYETSWDFKKHPLI